jgi:hypothetical protein
MRERMLTTAERLSALRLHLALTWYAGYLAFSYVTSTADHGGMTKCEKPFETAVLPTTSSRICALN